MRTIGKTTSLARAGIGLALGLGLLIPSAVAADRATARPHPSRSLAELSAEWWQWSLSIPTSAHPLAEKTGERCMVGQHGKHWFLGSSVVPSDDPYSVKVSRNCTIPAGILILIPVLNGECSTIEGNGDTEKELRTCARKQMADVRSTSARVDGKPVRVVRAESPLFSFTLPKDNVINKDLAKDGPNPSLSVADGYWMQPLLLRPGKHTLHTKGTANVSGKLFTLEVTYRITVVRPGAG
jgi:hypothetical protein